MAGLRINTFGGIAPRVNPRLRPDDIAQEALNALLDSGTLEPLPDDESQGAVAGISSSTQSIFPVTDTKWAAWDSDVDIIRSPIAEDPSKRLYWTDGGYPRMADLTTFISGLTYPTASYRLGIPRPTANVTTAISGTGVAGAVAQERAYTYTIVSDYGEEGPPAAVAVGDIIEVTEGETVTVTFPTLPSGNYNFIGKRLYRTDANGEYRFVADVTLAASTYDDTTLDEDLGEIIPTTTWEAPPDEVTADHPDGPLRGLLALTDGTATGFTGKTLCFSEPNLPHAWPTEYQLVTEYEIVGLAEIDVGVLVCTTGKPFVATGTNPTSRSLVLIDQPLACSSKRSIVDMGGYAIYASPEGLISVRGEGADNITEPLLTREQWQGYYPETIHAYRWEGKYVAFYKSGATEGGFIMDPRGGKAAFVPLNFYAKAGYSDPADGTLYLVIGGTLHKFARGTGSRTTSWKSKVFRAPRPFCPGVAKVDSEAYPLTFKMWADGALKHTQTVSNEQYFRLPAGYKGREFEVEVSGVSGRIHEIAVFESAREL